MKQIFIYFSLILLSVTMLNCSDSVDNGVTFQNLAAADVIVNFRASLVDVPSGETVELTEVFKGEYEYETIYEIPSGVNTASADGEMSGTFKIKAGTKILVVYTSTFSDSGYTIYASVTSSDDINDVETNPIGP